MEKKVIILSLAVIAMLGLAGAFYAMRGGNEGVEVGTSVGKKAPNFTLSDLNGNEFSLKGMREKVLILDFMATWCPGCRAEMTHLKQIESEYDESVLELVTIDIDPGDNLDQLETFKNEYEADWRFSKSVDVGNTYKISRIPTILIVDGDGIIRHKSGPISASGLKSKLENVI